MWDNDMTYGLTPSYCREVIKMTKREENPLPKINVGSRQFKFNFA